MDGESCIQRAYEAIFKGDYEAAGAWFERAVEADPFNPSYYYRGSITFARSGKLAAAMSYARRAVELAPDVPAYAEQLRMLQARRSIGQAADLLSHRPPLAEEALVLLQEACRDDPLAADARLLLGIACRMVGQYEQAQEALQEALQLNPQYEEARKALRELRADMRRRRNWR